MTRRVLTGTWRHALGWQTWCGVGIEAVHRECNIERKLHPFCGYDVVVVIIGDDITVCRSRQDDA